MTLLPDDGIVHDVAEVPNGCASTNVSTLVNDRCGVLPKEGKLIYRGINMTDIVRNCQKENRFGYEVVVWLLLLGDLPTQDQLDKFRAVLAEARELPDEFIEDMRCV